MGGWRRTSKAARRLAPKNASANRRAAARQPSRRYFAGPATPRGAPAGRSTRVTRADARTPGGQHGGARRRAVREPHKGGISLCSKRKTLESFIFLPKWPGLLLIGHKFSFCRPGTIIHVRRGGESLRFVVIVSAHRTRSKHGVEICCE